MSAPESRAPEQRAIDVLVRFGELLSGVAEPREVMRALSQTAVDVLGARAAVVVVIEEDGSAKLGAAAGVPEDVDLSDFPGEADDLLGPEMGRALLARCHEHGHCEGAEVTTLPLTSARDLFGSLVLVFVPPALPGPFERSLLQAVAGLAAAGLNNAARFAELAKSNAELRASREVLARSQKLRALGEMAAGVSHDLKNIINPLSLHLQFLRRAIPKDNADALESVGEMKGILERGLQTIERLRDFSRQAPAGRVEVVDLNQIVRESLAIASPRMRAKHDVHYKMVQELGDVPPVSLQSGEAVAATVNLLVNAVDAMPNGGTISVTTGRDAEGHGFVRVADDGPGMPPEVESRVFEPFFTTKGQEGTGLGLAMVYAFVQRNRGRIALETAPGKGAAFTMSFPAAR